MCATDLFESALKYLQGNYKQFRFFAERDIVWSVQQYIIEEIEEKNLPYKVSNNYPMCRGKNNRRSLCADLAIFNDENSNEVEVCAEFKYEPSHKRKDILKGKKPVVAWSSVKEDIERIKSFLDNIEDKKIKVAYAIFIDEGGYFRGKDPHPGSVWKDWQDEISILYSVFRSGG